jgi:hypothetical protein
MSAIDIKSPTASTSLTQDLYINNVNVGAVSYQTPIFVNLQDVATTPVTPISVSKPANVATVTLPTPAAAGVALQFPNPSTGISYRNFDTGWRAQNGWYAYTPPAYPAKYAQLDTTLGANQWYRLKTALTVNGVSSTNRFVDLSGVQGWAALNNLSYAVLDKLTGLMFTRSPISIGAGFANWAANISSAAANSVTINGNVYSDWYTIGMGELMSVFGTYLSTTTWTDPISSLTLVSGLSSSILSAEPSLQNLTTLVNGYTQFNSSGGYYTNLNANVTTYQTFWVHDAKNLIS